MPRGVKSTTTTASEGAEQCLIPGCENQVKNRGLCQGCCQAAAKHVKAGKSTWEELEAWGLCTQPKPRSKFVAEFERVATLKKNSKTATNRNDLSVEEESAPRRAAAPTGKKNIDDETVTPGVARRRIRTLLSAGGPQSIDAIIAQTQLDRATVIELLQDDPAFDCDQIGRHKLRGT